MKLSPIAAVLFTALALPGCGNSGPGRGYDPPTTQFADQLGIETPPPVTADEAKAIAAEAVGGTAISVDSETENGELLYEVLVRTQEGDLEVEVFAANGSVAEIEEAD